MNHCCHHSHNNLQEIKAKNITSKTKPGQIYTCPMHPEIRQEGPGNCPICGMALEPEIASLDEKNLELRKMFNYFLIALFLTLPIFAIEMTTHFFASHFVAWNNFLSPKKNQILQLFLSAPVVLGTGWPFFQLGFKSIINRKPNMFTLIAIGTGVAWIYSFIATLWPEIFPRNFQNEDGVVAVYFEAAAVITTLVLLGQVLELKAREYTSNAVGELLKLTPTIAKRIKPAGDEEEILVSEIQINDLLRIRPGDKIPTDAKIVEGSSNLDESMLTGESMPVKKTIDSKVIGGTLNIDGSLVIKAEKIGENTMLSQIIKMVSDAKRGKTEIQRLADEVALWFVPAVLLIALLTFLSWTFFVSNPAFGLVSAVAVLIIACPCALGLATPMSIIAAIGKGAQNGILIKNIQSLERLVKSTIIAVDKTGTLTEGKPKLTKIITVNKNDESSILAYASSVEALSEHPIAKAITASAKEKNSSILSAKNFITPIGKGVIAEVQDKKIALGNFKLMQEIGADFSDLEKKSDELRDSGATVIYMAIDGEAAALLAVSDPIKSTTKDALKTLGDFGLDVIMLTGDGRRTANFVATELGIKKVYAEILPQEKHKIIKELKEQGKIVAFVGDGINDAPALIESDIGIAVATGTDVAIESAGIVLLHGDLTKIAKAYSLSKKTIRNIKENLFFAFIYNALGIPIASGIFYPLFGISLSPAIAAAAMSLSSVSVIINSLRLKSVKI